MAKKNSGTDDGTGPHIAFAAPAGNVDITQIPTDSAPIGPKSKSDAEDGLVELGERLAALQERLYAQGTAGNPRSVLLLLQGMDTAGKDGVIKHVVGLVDPGGDQDGLVQEADRGGTRARFPVADREAGAAAPAIWGCSTGRSTRTCWSSVCTTSSRSRCGRARYEEINAFERRLADQQVTLVKCFLHVSKKVQSERLLARLDDPTKYWKYNPGDVDERRYWDAYQEAYSDALTRCNTVSAPWHVIPSDRKWYRNWAVAALLAETLEQLDPQYPPADFDIETERRRIAAT